MQVSRKKNDYDLNTAMPIGHAEIQVHLETGLSDQEKWQFTNSFSIGRHKSADVMIKNTCVSSIHAVVYYSKNKWWIIDMSSLNGTIIDGQRITKHQLGSQTQLRLGSKGPILKLYPEQNIDPLKKKDDQDDTLHISSTKLRVTLAEKHNDKKEFIFTRPFSVGRHSGADIRIDDSSVSRFHSIVYLREGKWWIKDMNSANGTIVNDQRISEQILGPQSQLRLGEFGPQLTINLEKTNLLDIAAAKDKFKQDGDINRTIVDKNKREVRNHSEIPVKKYSPDPINTPPTDLDKYSLDIPQIFRLLFKKYRKYMACVTPVILIGLILAGYGSLQENKKHIVDGDETTIAKIPVADGGRINDHEETENHVVVAPQEKKSQELPQQSPIAADDANKEAANEQNTIVMNRTADIYFDAAKTFANNRYWKVALEYYQNVSMINPDFPGVQTEIEKMYYEINNQASYEKGLIHINAGRYEEGIDRLDDISENSVYYLEASQHLTQAIKNKEQHNLANTLAAENKKADTALANALQYYAKGKIETSLKKLDVVLKSFKGKKAGSKYADRARALKKQIKYSASLYNKGNQEYASGQHDIAINTWKRLLEADQKLLRRKNSYFANIVSQKIADEFSNKALRAHSEGNFVDAYQYSKTALSIRADNKISLKVKNMLNEKSKQLFKEGYILEEYNPDNALEKWKLILKICAPGSEYYKKASKKIGDR